MSQHEPNEEDRPSVEDDGTSSDTSSEDASVEASRSRIIRIGPGGEADVLASTSAPLPSNDSSLRQVVEEGDSRDILSSMRGFSMESAHIQRVDKSLTESTIGAIARSTMSGVSSDQRPPVEAQPSAPTRPNVAARWVLVVLVVCLIAVGVALGWVVFGTQTGSGTAADGVVNTGADAGLADDDVTSVVGGPR